jgi:anti-sigma factor RsiW
VTVSHVGNDLLADFVEGLLPADDEARVAAHLTACPTCARARDALLDVSVLLRHAGAEPLPMPREVAERLEAALAAESRARSERTGVVSLRTAEPRHTPGTREGDRRGRRRRATGWRARPPRVLLAAASVAVLAVGAVAVRGILTSDTTTVAGNPPSTSTPSSTTTTPPTQAPRTFAFKTGSEVPAVSTDRFAAEVGQLLEARPASSTPTQKDLGMSGREPGVAVNADRCVERVLDEAGAGSPLDVTAGQLDGRPVQLAIVGERDRVRAYAIQGCPGANARIVHQASVTPR